MCSHHPCPPENTGCFVTVGFHQLICSLSSSLVCIADHSHTWLTSAVKMELVGYSKMRCLYSGLYSYTLSHPRSLYSLSSFLSVACLCIVLMKLCDCCYVKYIRPRLQNVNSSRCCARMYDISTLSTLVWY
jgi:hypothetical protein